MAEYYFTHALNDFQKRVLSSIAEVEITYDVKNIKFLDNICNCTLYPQEGTNHAQNCPANLKKGEL